MSQNINREEIVARLREIQGNSQSEISFGIARDGQPIVEWFDWGQGHSRPLSEEQIDRVIQFLQAYKPLCPDLETIRHSRYQFCGDYNCEECYRRERQATRSAYNHLDYLGPAEPGQVFLYQSGNWFDVAASVNPEKRLKDLSRKFGSELRLVHAIETNDKLWLKVLWMSNFGDYADRKGGYLLPSQAVQRFCNVQTQDVKRDASWEKNMGHVDLFDVANLPMLLQKAQYGYAGQSKVEGEEF